jgi:hypothetical protein
LTDASERIVKKEVAELRKLLKDSMKERSITTFEQQLDAYYDQKFTQFCYSRMYGTMLGYGEEVSNFAADEVAIVRDDVMDPAYLENWVSRYTNAFISRHIEESREQLAAALEREDVPSTPFGDAQGEGSGTVENSGTDGIEEELDAWEANRANEEGKEESVRLNGALANKVWALAGIAAMRWKVYGDTCPYCKALDGKVVGIHETFLQAGVSFPSASSGIVLEEGVVPLVPRQNKKHPPAHGGCDCGIEAVI